MGLHHFNTPSLDSKLTSKGNLGKNTKCSKGTKGCRIKYMQAPTKVDYSFLSLQFLLLQCIQGVPYIALQRGNRGSNLSDLEAYGTMIQVVQTHIEEKSKSVWIYAHIPMYAGLRSKVACTRKYGFKSRVQQ